jgi:flagellar biosynthetic protein FliP
MTVDPSNGDAALAVDPSPAHRTRRLARFAGHYLEMVLAMVVGMVALAPLWPAAWVASEGVHAIVMATDMTVAMVLWMAVRRHRWPRIAEMAAAMYLPFVALLVPWGLGVLSGSALMVAGHVIMFPLMLLAMLWRRHEYGL